MTRSLSRPRTSNDNPYSEANFKTAKYRPDYPSRFESPEEARAWVRRFVAWYNAEHYHSGIAYLHPADVHAGTAAAVVDARQDVLDAAYAEHPARFRHRPPVRLRRQSRPVSTDRRSKRSPEEISNQGLMQ